MELPKRKHTRLKNYDYSQNGYYFITICTHNKKYILSNIVGQGLAPAEIQLSKFGKIANDEILNLENRYHNIKMDKYVIMPNHIHAIIVLQNNTAGASPCPTLSDIICTLKSIVTHKCHILNSNIKIWSYIDTNPQKWNENCFYIE